MARLWLHDYDVGALTGVRRPPFEPRRRYQVSRPHRQVPAAILMAVGLLGIAVLPSLVSGPWEVPSFAVSVVVLVSGLVLTWTRRAR